MDLREWTPVAKYYNPVLSGSIDATDTEPHDHGVVRALNSIYTPNKGVVGDPKCTLFIGRLNYLTNEDQIRSLFSKYGHIKRCRLVRDFITGFSRGYAFVEFTDTSDAKYAANRLNHTILDDATIITMFECERTLPGWVPRRLGGGFGGKKESGQLRFGGLERPFKRPIIIPTRLNHCHVDENIQHILNNNTTKGNNHDSQVINASINDSSNTNLKNKSEERLNVGLIKDCRSQLKDQHKTHSHHKQLRDEQNFSYKNDTKEDETKKYWRSSDYRCSGRSPRRTHSKEVSEERRRRPCSRSKRRKKSRSSSRTRRGHRRRSNNTERRNIEDKKSPTKFVRSQLSMTPERKHL